MTYDPKVLNATLQEKADAFEWLRQFAITGGKDWRKAAILVEEIARYGASAAPEAEWKAWFGGDCPLSPDATVEVVFRDGVRDPFEYANGWVWKHHGNNGDIIAYRVLPSRPQRGSE